MAMAMAMGRRRRRRASSGREERRDDALRIGVRICVAVCEMRRERRRERRVVLCRVVRVHLCEFFRVVIDVSTTFLQANFKELVWKCPSHGPSARVEWVVHYCRYRRV